MLSYKDVRDEVLALFPGLIEAARTRGAAEPASRLEAAQRQLRDGTLRVVVCGEFKRGKSSLLNALLGDFDLLPEGQAITTSMITTIGYRPVERIRVYLADEYGKIACHEISRGELRGYVTERENPRNVKQVQQVSIEIASDRLKPGLVLVDTPGVSGLEDAHARATDAMVRAADALVFVTDTTEPITRGEEKLLRQAAMAARRLNDENALLFVVTKIDRMGDAEERRAYVARTREDIAAALRWPSPQVRVTAVSSTSRRRYVETGSDRHKDRSNFAELESVIWATLARRQAGMLLHGALADIQAAAESMARPLREAIRAADSPATARAMRSTIGARAEDLRQKAADSAPWRTALTAGMATIQKEVTDLTVTESRELWKQLAGQADDLLDQQDEINAIAADNVLRIFALAEARLSKAGAALQQKLSSDYGLMAGTAELARLPAPPVPQIRVRAALPVLPPMNLRRIASVGSIINVTVSSLLKAILPIVGVIGVEELVGAAGGGLAASAFSAALLVGPRLRVQLAQKKDREERLADARDQIDQIAQEMSRESEDFVAMGARAYADAIRAELLSRIIQERDSALESARRLGEDGPVDAAGAMALRRELQAQLAPLAQAVSRATELARAAHDLACADD